MLNDSTKPAMGMMAHASAMATAVSDTPFFSLPCMCVPAKEGGALGTLAPHVRLLVVVSALSSVTSLSTHRTPPDPTGRPVGSKTFHFCCPHTQPIRSRTKVANWIRMWPTADVDGEECDCKV